eukprot:gb/GEZN01012973.1/.p1 GENE.gb/GEZN01012973.1/~~gb/GEZN01012973.1/.p1  ORF type:complete len:307 (-),score=81.62 gb/GEZN01012973.1/:124-1020(-)
MAETSKLKLLLLLAYLLCMTLLFVVFLYHRRSAQHVAREEQLREQQQQERQALAQHAQDARRRVGGAARLRRALHGNGAVGVAGAVGDAGPDQLPPQALKKQTAKEQKKAFKQQQLQERQQRELLKAKKEEARLETMRIKAEAREAKQQAMEQDKARAMQEERQKEEAELAQWKNQIEMDDEGHGAAEHQERQEEIDQQFIIRIKQNKITPLLVLAAEFDISIEEIVRKIRLFEEVGELTGVLDDRGKYIHITSGELNSVSAYVRRKGRVSLSDLTTECNRLISLSSVPSSAASPVQL